MQDRFKYRVWNNKKRKYEDDEKDELDYFLCCFPGVVYESHCCVFDDLTQAEEGHYTLEQCTGLKDKNGKLIYEGDIVERYVGLGKRGSQKTKDIDVVKWQINGYVLENYCDYFSDTDDFEVIGNIHENHELLED